MFPTATMKDIRLVDMSLAAVCYLHMIVVYGFRLSVDTKSNWCHLSDVVHVITANSCCGFSLCLMCHNSLKMVCIPCVL